MINLFRHPDFKLGASAAFIVVVSGLVGQYAAQGMDAQQWFHGLTAIAGAITLGVILRCWPTGDKVRARIDDR